MSNRKVDLLKGKCLEDEMKVKTLIEAAMTRWLTIGQGVDRMIDLIVQVLESLIDISEDNYFDHEDRLKCKGLFSSLLSSRNLKVLLMLHFSGPEGWIFLCRKGNKGIRNTSEKTGYIYIH